MNLKIEKLGGVAGFGGPQSHLQSSGEINMDELSFHDKQQIENLFKKKSLTTNDNVKDGFMYRLSLNADIGTETIIAAEKDIPQTIKACVKDKLI